MKIYFLKLSILYIVLAFTACGIDEPQTKPDYTLGGKQMFDKAELHVTMLTDWMDVLLKMNTYIESNDADKIKIEDKYFPNYKIRNTAINTWLLIQMNDTVCTIYTDGKAFTTAGANWGIEKKNMEIPCQFSCISANKWAMKVSNFDISKNTNYNYYDYYNPYSNDYSLETFTSDSIVFYSDNATPEDFSSNNFEVSGEGEFLMENNTQKVKLTYEIDNTLKHDSNASYNMSSGKYILSAQDMKSSKKGSGSADFEILLGDERKVIIEYNGRTQTYPRN